MKAYAHTLDADRIAENLASEREALARGDAEIAEHERAGNALFLFMHGESLQTAVAYRYALGEPAAALRDDLTRSLRPRVRAIELGVVVDPFDFTNLLALAISLRRSDETRSLATLDPPRYSNPDVVADPIVFAVALLLKAFAIDPAALPALSQELDPARGNVAEIYRYDRMLFVPLVELLRAVVARDQIALEAGFARRDEELARFFRRADDPSDPQALLDIRGLAVAALALDRRLRVADDSPYRPLDLLRS